MNAQKAVLPGMMMGVLFLILVTSLFSSAGKVVRVMSQGSASLASVARQASAARQSEVQGFCAISDRYPSSVMQWCDLIEQYSTENGLDPKLVSAVILKESNGQPDAYSKSGAVGLMQVMPRDGLAARFICLNGPCFSDRPSMKELFDPEYNVAYGTRMLASLIRSTGNLREALKAYGPKDVGYQYADQVLSTFNSN